MNDKSPGTAKIKVVFIAGWGRSGTTLLDTMLGEVNGFLSLGELRYLWDRGLIENQHCGCGRAFRDCDFWQEILQRAQVDVSPDSARMYLRLRESLHSRTTLLSLFPGGRRVISGRLGSYPLQFEKIYQALAQEPGCEVLVDSSKFPSHGFVLDMIPSIELYVLHLVRDPRAVAYSWNRKKVFDSDADRTIYIPRLSPLRSSWLWLTWNATLELLWGRSPRYIRLRYEDLIQDPEKQLRRIQTLLGTSPTTTPLNPDGSLTLHANHTVSGNPNRFKTGLVRLRLDQEWSQHMGAGRRLLVSLVTWPLLRRYSYPWW